MFGMCSLFAMPLWHYYDVYFLPLVVCDHRVCTYLIPGVFGDLAVHVPGMCDEEAGRALLGRCATCR